MAEVTAAAAAAAAAGAAAGVAAAAGVLEMAPDPGPRAQAEELAVVDVLVPSEEAAGPMSCPAAEASSGEAATLAGATDCSCAAAPGEVSAQLIPDVSRGARVEMCLEAWEGHRWACSRIFLTG